MISFWPETLLGWLCAGVAAILFLTIGRIYLALRPLKSIMLRAAQQEKNTDDGDAWKRGYHEED